MKQQNTPRSRCAALLAILFLTLTATAALAQRAIPPTARQAAQSPAFASRLHPPGGGAQLLRFPQSGLTSGSPQDLIYDNGPYNGTTDAWTINFGFAVSDSFLGSETITGLQFVYWDASTTDLLTSVDMAAGTTPFSGSFQTSAYVINTFLGLNQYGYALYLATVAFPGLTGAGYITLQNACSTTGCSVSNPIYWDENSGPSTAYGSSVGSIPSEAFSLAGGPGPPPPPPPPPPPSCMSSEGDFNIIHDFTPSEDPGNGGSNLAIDSAGNPYGTTSGGNYGLGMVYELVQQAQDWALAPLYSFTGTYNGYLPWLLKGPDGGLYGTAYYGGIQDCGQYGCGFVYRLTPAPTACLTSSCTWSESTLHTFVGNGDGENPATLAFGQNGNLYGAARAGGAFGQGVVYELTPSHGGWTEKILYTFAGGDDGGFPGSLVVGIDGNVYGVAGYGGAYGNGVVYQLERSGSSWTQHVIHAFNEPDDGIYPTNLRRDNSGNLYGTSSYHYSWGSVPTRVFMLSPSANGWVFSIIWQAQHHFEYIGGLTADVNGNLYGVATNSGEDNDPAQLYFEVFMRTPDGQFQQWGKSGLYFPAGSGLVADRWSKVYGSTGFCGTYSRGTVWRFSGFSSASP